MRSVGRRALRDPLRPIGGRRCTAGVRASGGYASSRELEVICGCGPVDSETANEREPRTFGGGAAAPASRVRHAALILGGRSGTRDSAPRRMRGRLRPHESAPDQLFTAVELLKFARSLSAFATACSAFRNSAWARLHVCSASRSRTRTSASARRARSSLARTARSSRLLGAGRVGTFRARADSVGT